MGVKDGAQVFDLSHWWNGDDIRQAGEHQERRGPVLTRALLRDAQFAMSSRCSHRDVRYAVGHRSAESRREIWAGDRNGAVVSTELSFSDETERGEIEKRKGGTLTLEIRKRGEACETAGQQEGWRTGSKYFKKG